MDFWNSNFKIQEEKLGILFQVYLVISVRFVFQTIVLETIRHGYRGLTIRTGLDMEMEMKM